MLTAPPIRRLFREDFDLLCLFVQIQYGAIPVPKSQTKGRIQQNIDIFDFELTPDEVTILDGFNSGHRIALLPALKHSKYYPFNIEFWCNKNRIGETLNGFGQKVAGICESQYKSLQVASRFLPMFFLWKSKNFVKFEKFRNTSGQMKQCGLWKVSSSHDFRLSFRLFFWVTRVVGWSILNSQIHWHPSTNKVSCKNPIFI